MSDQWRYGWVDSTIVEWLAANLDAIPVSAHVVLTTIDSGRAVSSSPMLADALGREREVPGGPMSMTVDELLTIAETALSSFSEAWLLREPAVGVLPDAPDRLDCSEEMDKPSPELVEWMDAHGVLLGVGDGLGLAYVCRRGPDTDDLVFETVTTDLGESLGEARRRLAKRDPR